MSARQSRTVYQRTSGCSSSGIAASTGRGFGPVTEANVIVFQLANGLNPTGVVDRATWNALFAPGAKYFDAQAAQELSKRRR